MQTFDVLPRAIHSAPDHPGEANFTSQKSPPQSEQFGDVMDRTLNGAANESPDKEAAQRAAIPDQKKTGTETAAPHHGKPAEKAKKSDHAAKSQHSDSSNTPPQPLVVNACAAQLSQLAPLPAKKGNSENTSTDDSKKAPTTMASGTSNGPVKTSLAQLLTSAAAVGVPAPAPAPKTPVASGSAKPAPESTGRVIALPAKTEAPDPAAGHLEVKTTDLKNPGEKIASAKSPDAEAAGAKNPADTGPSAVKETLAQQLSADSGDSQPENPAPNNPSEPAAAPPPDPKFAQITRMAHSAAAQSAVPVSPPDPGGTSAAKQYVTMNKAEKTQKVAGQTEQELPGNDTLKSADLPTGQKSSSQALSQGNTRFETNAIVEAHPTSTLSTTTEIAAPAVTTVAMAPAIATDTRLRVLERTHDIVALHAMRLAETSSNSLHVVVKPGAGVQLSLELRQNAGQIDVHASLHKGDFEHLSQCWPELQQRLEARGVRVGALTTSENFSSTSHQNFQQSKQQQSPNQDPLHAGAFAEFALAGSMTEAPATRAARATAYRGWETWA